MLNELRTHKAELLEMLQPEAPAGEPLFPDDLLAALGAATVRWADQPHGESLEGPDLQPAAVGWDDCQPSPGILAAPVVMCPRCGSARVLPELQAMTGGLCWGCYVRVAVDVSISNAILQ